MKYFIWIVIGVVIIAVLGGFFIIGSPQTERLRRFDEERVNHLQFLQQEIIQYWTNKSRLPEKLEDLEDPLRGISIPKEPQTQANYEYKVLGPESFELCATFALASRASLEIQPPQPFFREGNWQHGSGRVCFERTIDKEFYRPQKPLLD